MIRDEQSADGDVINDDDDNIVNEADQTLLQEEVEEVEPGAQTLQSKSDFRHRGGADSALPARARLAAWCPTMDLIAIVTVENAVCLYRLNWQLLWTIEAVQDPAVNDADAGAGDAAAAADQEQVNPPGETPDIQPVSARRPPPAPSSSSSSSSSPSSEPALPGRSPVCAAARRHADADPSSVVPLYAVDESTRITAIAWRPDGRVIALGRADGHIMLVDTEGGRCCYASQFSEFPRRVSSTEQLVRMEAVTCLEWTLADSDSHSANVSATVAATLRLTGSSSTGCGSFENSSSKLLPPPMPLIDKVEAGFLGANPSALERLLLPLPPVPAPLPQQQHSTPRAPFPILVVGRAGGFVELTAYGVCRIGSIPTPDASPPARASLSKSLFALSMVSVSKIDSNDAADNGDAAPDNAQPPTTYPPPSANLAVFDTSFLATRTVELQAMAHRYTQSVIMEGYILEALQTIRDLLSDGIVTAATRFHEAIIQSYSSASEVSLLTASHAFQRDLLDHLWHGAEPPGFRAFLNGISAQTIRKYSLAVKQACEQVSTLLTGTLQPALQLALAQYSDLGGLARWHDRFGVLGLAPERVQDCVAWTQALMLKVDEMVCAVNRFDQQMEQLLSWLHTVAANSAVATDKPLVEVSASISAQIGLKVAEYLAQSDDATILPAFARDDLSAFVSFNSLPSTARSAGDKSLNGWTTVVRQSASGVLSSSQHDTVELSRLDVRQPEASLSQLVRALATERVNLADWVELQLSGRIVPLVSPVQLFRFVDHPPSSTPGLQVLETIAHCIVVRGQEYEVAESETAAGLRPAFAPRYRQPQRVRSTLPYQCVVFHPAYLSLTQNSDELWVLQYPVAQLSSGTNALVAPTKESLGISVAAFGCNIDTAEEHQILGVQDYSDATLAVLLTRRLGNVPERHLVLADVLQDPASLPSCPALLLSEKCPPGGEYPLMGLSGALFPTLLMSGMLSVVQGARGLDRMAATFMAVSGSRRVASIFSRARRARVFELDANEDDDEEAEEEGEREFAEQEQEDGAEAS
ncbi:hypothetical protein CAOG_05504 [Capsaspora owczarzaki ATCC 30864]|uniref:Anaphase-promoting complex subunit 4 n=1 Tax=Capsaspora owczarzaki (strain ATCC 30864) TaxID=595528 RepID=A0A0D2WTI3_CAPO3|nr:hypothetical protein CAOG_05504 [Capsaspora owczarzaki ATCC 30864]KJE94968.1 hypothetical protein CAOG_005504 [Capsaspora owczarzaki ATCC 30864]|eukprot:XP_004346177.1 hypothetical protein CAOG_05504 [Capsaspora owczarzaki ATCC 30864]